MKLRFIIASVVAAAALLVGCQKEETATYLSDLKVSSSYIALTGDKDVNIVTITVEAAQPWSISQIVQVDSTYYDDVKGKTTIKVDRYQVNTGVASDLIVKENKWFTVSPLKGEAGTTQVTFTAPKATQNQLSNIKIFVGNNAQNLIVSQAFKAEDPAVVTVEDVIDGVDGVTYRVQGTCSSISSTIYGNFYMKGDTGKSLYIYGTVDATGSYNWDSFNIAVGDKVTVQGPRSTYGSTIELVDATFIKVEKALILSESSTKYLSEESQTIEVPLTVKGTSLHFETLNDWLAINPGYKTDEDGNLVFSITAAANTTGETRNGVVTFKSSNDKSSTTFDLAIEQVGTSAVDGTVKALADSIKLSTDKKNPKRFDMNLTDAVVSYKAGSSLFIQDANGGLCIYDENCKLNVGDVINGRVYGYGYTYNGLPEATLFKTSLATVESGDAPEPVEASVADIVANFDSFLSKYVIIKGANVYKKIDVNFNKVLSAGAVGDAANNLTLNINSTASFADEGQEKATKRYFYLQFAEGESVNAKGIVGVNNDTKQLNVYDSKQVTTAGK